MKRVLAVGLVVAVALPATAGARTLVSYTEAGGIANRRVALTVTTTGVANVTANRRPRTFRLHTATLSHLRRLLAAARFDRVHPPPTSCADCLIYSVHYRGHRARYDDSQARHVPRSVRVVVAELARIARGGR